MTDNEIDRLKRAAKKLHKETGVSHSQALEEIAKRLDFASWGALMQEHNSSKTNADLD